MSAAELVTTGLTRTYDPGSPPALAGLDLHLAPGSFTALLGPSGCGKSTTLRILAGLLAPSAGDVLLDGTSLLAVPAERRPVALVFQRPTLFPHLDVAANVGFGLRMAGTPRARRRARVGDMLDRVRLTGLERRRPDQLSGGQEQRVALARALVTRPRVLLLDEPFSQLDTALRAEMRALVRELHDTSPVTTLFVTHDQAEAVAVADRIALLDAGRLLGEGAPETFFTRPPSLAAARFFGFLELPGRVADGVFAADTAPAGAPAPGLADGPAVLVWRPEVATVYADRSGDAVVEAVAFAGAHQEVRLRWGGAVVTVHVPVTASHAVGARVGVRVPAERSAVFPTSASAPGEGR